MVYMTFYFIAGAIGSSVGAILWQRFGWAGVCGFGCALLIFGCLVFALGHPDQEAYAKGVAIESTDEGQ